MFYFTAKTLGRSFDALRENVENKFIGLLGILRLLRVDEIKKEITYSIPNASLSDWLNDELCLAEDVKPSASSFKLFVKFSKRWEENVQSDFVNGSVSIYSLLVFLYKYDGFETAPSGEELLSKFCAEFHLAEETVLRWFTKEDLQMEFSDTQLTKQECKRILKVKGDNITLNPRSKITARPGELARAPYVQTLYAGMEAVKCLLILKDNIDEYYSDFGVSNEKDYENPNQSSDFLPLQQIFYGAPGTGKSHAIKERTEAWEKRDRVVRTTFHPDSDYSTFVGCYKPTTEELVRRSQDDKETTEKVISYDFVGQAFLSAYVDAWKDRTQPEFLVIEEINRGNCAQIFGDLFQLLDRGDDGYSEYAIRADKDLQKYLEAAFKDVDIADYPKVKAGTEMLLPSNLRIWATMNTSDQSLFPIDSAFKRRWDWKYIPIAQGEADGGKPLDWRVEAGGKLYDWWDFLKEINKKVFDTTNSADKQMGFFFCKAKDGVISAETFVSKVVFYLWNDVFKDYGFDDQAFNDGQAGSGEKLTFDAFYNAKGEVVVGKIQRFLDNLGVKPADKSEASEEDVEEEEEEDSPSHKKLTVTFPDGTEFSEGTKFEIYANVLRKIGMDRVESVASQKKYVRRGCAFVSKVEEEGILNAPDLQYKFIDGYYVIHGINDEGKIAFLNHLTEELDLGLQITHE